MAYRPGRNNYIERFTERLDREAALGDYGTGNPEFDELMSKLNAERKKENDFISVYGEAAVNLDLQSVKKVESSSSYQNERPERATLVESVIAYGIANRGWLGPECKVRLASKFDDIFRGVDMLIEVPHPKSTPEKTMPLRFTVDVTASSDPDVIEKKFASSISRLDYGNNSRGNPGGQLTTLKYMFKPSKEKPKTDKSQPKYNHYILALDGEQARILADSFVREKDSENKTYLELEAQIKVIYLLHRQANIQLGEAMDRYCNGSEHVLWEYRSLPSEDKDDFEKLFVFVEENIGKIEEHLKENWIKKSSGEEINNSDILVSIKKNLAAVEYFNRLLKNLSEKEKTLAILRRADSEGFDGDPGAHALRFYGRRETESLRKTMHPPRRPLVESRRY